MNMVTAEVVLRNFTDWLIWIWVPWDSFVCQKLAAQERSRDCRDHEDKNEELTVAVTVINEILFQFTTLELWSLNFMPMEARDIRRKHNLRVNVTDGTLKPIDLSVRVQSQENAKYNLDGFDCSSQHTSSCWSLLPGAWLLSLLCWEL